jgi:hypothetical protein
LAILASYFDAAGYEGGPHAVTVGGFVGDLRAWSRLSLQWPATLKAHGISTNFRMTAFVNGSKGFERFRGQPDLQATVLRELVELICRNTRHSFGTTVLSKDWEEVNREYRLKECHCTPYGGSSICCHQ